MDILRFITAGNVDDGKSTLIGRLLYDTGNIKKDVLKSVADTSQNTPTINLAHITDGLRSERLNKITIDVAYQYFTSKYRKYIITDAPGHFEFTRNMVTGASGVDAMIILIDAKNGITDQTRRHSLVASFLKIGHVVVAVNKMDLVNYDERVFTSLMTQYLTIAGQLQMRNITFIPVSALWGDNISVRSTKMEWYAGGTLMQYLEKCIPLQVNFDRVRFSIQYANDKSGKGYSGKMLSGKLRVGDVVAIFPDGQAGIVNKIIHGYDEAVEANAGENVRLFFMDKIKAGRGDIIAKPGDAPKSSNELNVTICWLNADAPLVMDTQYYLRINGKETICRITDILYKIDINTFEKYKTDKTVEVNQFARIRIKTDEFVSYDSYDTLRENGRGIIIDVNTNYTSGAFVI